MRCTVVYHEYMYDLEERTGKFGGSIIRLCKILPRDVITLPLIGQIIRSSTSIGANYMEANGASSRKDFLSITRMSGAY